MGPLITAAFAHELTLPDIYEETNVRTKRGKDDREPQRTATVMASYLRCATGHPHVVMANFGQTNFRQLWCYSQIVWPNTVMTKSGLWCGVCVVVASGPPGATAQAQMCTFQGPGLQTTKIPREYSQGKQENCGGRGQKKRENLGPTLRLPTLRLPPRPTLRSPQKTETPNGQKSVWPKSTSAAHVPMELEEKPTLTVAEKPGDRP